MSLIYFEIDADGLENLVAELAATEKQVKFALSRALARTATTLRTMSARYLRDSLELRTINLLRNRLKSLRLRATGGDGMALWFGLNDMPASWFKGTPKQGKGGASFRGQDFPGAFVGRSKFKNRKTIMKRVGKARLPVVEQQLPIGDKAQVTIEDEIFDKTEAIFWQHFERDLRARVAHGVGMTTYRQFR